MTRATGAFLGGCALLCLAVLLAGTRQLETPGLYYDEAIQALPAAEFLRDEGRPLQVPGAHSRWLFGGWFPLLTQPYMGALKSQLLIPVFAVSGASVSSLRLTTLLWSCVGLLLCACWVRSIAGTAVALLTAALLATDPSFLFIGRHDWGSVALALALRGGGLWLVTAGWQRESTGRLFGGALLLGLGIFNKIDFAVFLGGVGLAWVLVAQASFWRRLAGTPGKAAAAAAGLVTGAAPMLFALSGVLGATQAVFRSQGMRADDLGEKLDAWQFLLDGSYFQRLILAGGSFERLELVTDAASSPFPWVLAAALLFLAGCALRDARGAELRRVEAFALAATVLVFLALLAVPRAARIHHVMNVQPLPQLAVALAAARLWRAGALPLRGLAATGVAIALLGGIRVDARTFQTLEASGGRGRWSDAVEHFAREIPAGSTVVSLDWGFHAPLRFLHPELALEEPVWGMHTANPSRSFVLAGGPEHVYLVQEPGYDVFPMGQALLDAVVELPVGAASVLIHVDRQGEPAFRSIRFARPHQLVYRGDFEVRLR